MSPPRSSEPAALAPPGGAGFDAVLEVRDLHVHFDTEEGELRAVDGVTFLLRRSRVLAIVGESGCGKSVTAHAIMRLIQPPGRIAGGSIVVRPADEPAIDVTALPEGDPRLYEVRGGLISMIFQEPMSALSPVHTIGNQIMEAILLHQDVGEDEARRRAVDMLQAVGIPAPGQRIDQYPHQLSGGMRQRAIVAMALVCRPEVLIADEPTTALDVTLQAQILGLIKRMQVGIGCAVVLVTHNMGVVAQMADDVAVMYLGRVVEQGPVDRVLKVPRHPYTIGLMHSIPGRGGPGGRRLSSIQGSVPALRRVPPGCPFHPRCPWAQPGRCDLGPRPELHVFRRRLVACHRAEEIARELEPQEGAP